jgi:hypothetical protein
MDHGAIRSDGKAFTVAMLDYSRTVGHFDQSIAIAILCNHEPIRGIDDTKAVAVLPNFRSVRPPAKLEPIHCRDEIGRIAGPFKLARAH